MTDGETLFFLCLIQWDVSEVRVFINQPDGLALNDLVSQCIHVALFFQPGTNTSRRDILLSSQKFDVQVELLGRDVELIFLRNSFQDEVFLERL